MKELFINWDKEAKPVENYTYMSGEDGNNLNDNTNEEEDYIRLLIQKKMVIKSFKLLILL
mgnify:CR=1 FL=1